MDKFPMCLYRAGTAFKWDCGTFDTLAVADEAEHAAALSDGWHESAADASAVLVDKPPAEPVTRDDLLAQAAKAGIKVDGRWSDERLAKELA